MVAVTFNKEYFAQLLRFKLDDKKLADQIAKMGLDVEEISSKEIKLDVSPNRPDMLDIVGFIRSLKNFMHKSSKLKYEIKDAPVYLEIEVGKNASNFRPFISGMVVKNLKMSDETLKHLINFTEKFSINYGRNRRKLAIGLHNLDTIVPPVRYDAFPDESFLPLNRNKEMKFSEIIATHEKGLAYGKTIPKKEAQLYPALKDNMGVLSLIPIINSERTKVSSSTRNLLVDITGTSQYIIEKSTDLFAAMFIDMGADVYKIKVKYSKSNVVLPKMTSKFINIPLMRLEGQIGVIIGYNNVLSLASKMGYEAALIGKSVRFRVPEYRLDIINDQDIIEDIAIAYGYDYIRPVPIYSEQRGELDATSLLRDKVSRIMLGLGFSEMFNSYLTNEAINFDNMRISREKEYVRIKNAKSQQISMMRTSIIPSLLKDLGSSLHDKMPQKLFEFDLAFKISREDLVESNNLSGVIADPKVNFNQMKAIVEEILYDLELNYTIEEKLQKSFIEGRCASVNIDGKEIGVFGELHPEVLSNFGIEEPAVAFEIIL